MQAAILKAAVVQAATVNPYHPDKHNHVAFDTLLVTIGMIILILLVVVPAHLARARELRRLQAQQPQAADQA